MKIKSHFKQISKRGTVMLTIVTGGKSYTRHCTPLGDGNFQGVVLDFEKGHHTGSKRMYQLGVTTSDAT